MGTDWKPEVQDVHICVTRKESSQTQRRLLAKGVLNSELRKRTSKSTQSINNLNNIGIKNKGRRKWKHVDFFNFHFTFIYFFLCVLYLGAHLRSVHAHVCTQGGTGYYCVPLSPSTLWFWDRVSHWKWNLSWWSARPVERKVLGFSSVLLSSIWIYAYMTIPSFL